MKQKKFRLEVRTKFVHCGWSNPETDCPEMLWNIAFWRYSKHNWTKTWV